MYLNGQGVRTDFVQGFAWNSIAAGQGDAYAESIENQLGSGPIKGIPKAGLA